MKVCFEFFINLEAVRDKYLGESKFSKDDMKDNISDDDVHRARLRSKVKLSIDVFNSDHHTKGRLFSVVTGKIIVRNWTVKFKQF